VTQRAGCLLGQVMLGGAPLDRHPEDDQLVTLARP
jgi:hypothetical protein